MRTRKILSSSLAHAVTNFHHSFEDWSDLYTTNVIAPFFLSTAFLPLLQKSTERTHGWSSTIINISSISGLVRISQGHFNYNASKGAMVHLNKMLSSEIQSSGLKIRVNAIAPGVFPSEMTTGESKDDQKSELPKEHKGDPAKSLTWLLLCFSLHRANTSTARMFPSTVDTSSRLVPKPYDSKHCYDV
jgi:NAD(P)-dependent dehydrogenase (short-subunit alcohol dehydrogenase family)